jgi:hypothetical protein
MRGFRCGPATLASRKALRHNGGGIHRVERVKIPTRSVVLGVPISRETLHPLLLSSIGFGGQAGDVSPRYGGEVPLRSCAPASRRCRSFNASFILVTGVRTFCGLRDDAYDAPPICPLRICVRAKRTSGCVICVMTGPRCKRYQPASDYLRSASAPDIHADRAPARKPSDSWAQRRL